MVRRVTAAMNAMALLACLCMGAASARENGMAHHRMARHHRAMHMKNARMHHHPMTRLKVKMKKGKMAMSKKRHKA